MRMQVQSPALLRGLGIWHCHELWCRSQMRLISRVAVAVVAAAALIRLLPWEPPYAMGAALEKAKRQKQNKTKESDQWILMRSVPVLGIYPDKTII